MNIIKKQILSLEEHAEALPESGVYLFRFRNIPLYVGRSINVKRRLRHRAAVDFILNGSCSFDMKHRKGLDAYTRAPAGSQIIIWYCSRVCALERFIWLNLKPVYNGIEPSLKHVRKEYYKQQKQEAK